MSRTRSTFENGSYSNSSWLCACGRSPVWRVVGKEGPTKGERFLRCCPPSGERQCSFFLWEADEAEACNVMTQRHRQRASVVVPVVTPSIPPNRDSSPSTLSATTTTTATTATFKPASPFTTPSINPVSQAWKGFGQFNFNSPRNGTQSGTQATTENHVIANTPKNTRTSHQEDTPTKSYIETRVSLQTGTSHINQASAYSTQTSDQSATQPIIQPATPINSQADLREFHSGAVTPQSTPSKQPAKDKMVMSDVVVQITDRLSTDGVVLKASTEMYFEHIFREKIAIYEAKIRERDNLIDFMMERLDQLSVKSG